MSGFIAQEPPNFGHEAACKEVCIGVRLRCGLGMAAV
jgi:hypothetical protein